MAGSCPAAANLAALPVLLFAFGFCYGLVNWNAITELGGLNDDTARLIDRELTNFRSTMRLEQSRLGLQPISRENSDSDEDDHPMRPQFSVPEDSYWPGTWRTDNPQQLRVSSLEAVNFALASWAVADLDVVASVQRSCVMIASTSGVDVTCREPGGRQLNDTSAFEGTLTVTGIQVHEDDGDGATAAKEERLMVFVLHRAEADSELRVTWWSPFNDTFRTDKISESGSIPVDHDALFIKAVPVHVTDSHMVAVVGRQVIEMYPAGPGGLSPDPCDRLDAVDPTDLISFHINGRLYLVAASARPGSSVVWKYDSGKDTFDFHHGLEEAAIHDVEYFRHRHGHHVAAAGPEGASIYRWERSRLLRVQHWGPDVAGPRPVWCSLRPPSPYANDAVLLLASDKGATFHAWSDHQKLFVAFGDAECIRWSKVAPPVDSEVLNYDVEVEGEARTFCIKSKSCVGIASVEGLEYPIGIGRQKTPSVDYQSYHKKITHPVESCWPSPMSNVQLASLVEGEHLALILRSKETLTTFRTYFAKRMLSTNTRDDTSRILQLNNRLEQQKTLLQETSSILEAIHLQLAPSRTPSEENACPTLRGLAENIGQQLRFAEQELRDLMRHDGTVRLEGDVQLESLTVTGNVRGGDVVMEIVNGLNVTELMADSVTNGSTERIDGIKTFRGKTVVGGPVQVLRKLNTHRVSHDLLMLDRPQSTRGNVEFGAPVTVSGDLNVAGLVNGMRLAEEVISLRDEGTTFAAAGKSFLEAVTVEEEVVLAGKINGLKLASVAKNVVTSVPKLGHTLRVIGNKTFVQARVLGNLGARRVAGIDQVQLERTAVRTDRATNVVATKRFAKRTRVEGPGSRLMALNVGGLSLPEDVVLRSEDGSVTLGAKKTFSGETVVVGGHLGVDGRLDGVNVDDLALSSGDQRLCGRKEFRGEVTGPELDVGRMSGEVAAATRVVVHGSLQISGRLNGIEVEELLSDVVYRNESDLVFAAPVTFARSQSLNGDVHVLGTVNGLNLQEDFVSVDHETAITAEKKFLRPVFFEGNILCAGTWDGVNVSRLAEETVRKDGASPRTVSGKKNFVDGLTVESLSANASDAGLYLSSLQATNVQVAGNVEVQGTVNSANLGKAISERLAASGNKNVNGSLVVEGRVRMDHLDVSGKLNGVDVAEVWNDVLWKDTYQRKQVVGSSKRFAGVLTCPYVTAKRGVNGISLAELEPRTVKVTNGSFFSAGGLEFLRARAREVTLAGYLNGHNLERLAENSVASPRSSLSIKGQKEFEDLHVKGSIRVAGRVNGLDLARDVLTSSGGQRNVTGNYTFCSNVLASEAVKVSGTLHVAGVSDGGRSYEGRVAHFGGDAETDFLHTDGLVNGIDLNLLHLERLGNAGVTAHLKGGAHFLKNLTVLGDINDYNYPGFFEQVVVNDEGLRTITAAKQFTKSVKAANARVEEANLLIHKSFNGIDMKAVANDDPRSRKIISGSVIIPNHVTVSGNVAITNGEDRHHPRPNKLYECRTAAGTTTVEELRLTGSVLAASVNGHADLRDLETDTMKTGHQVVTGKKTASGAVVFRGKMLSDPAFGEDYLLLPDVGRLEVSSEREAFGTATSGSLVQGSEEICSVSDRQLVRSILKTLPRSMARTVDIVQRSTMFHHRPSGFQVFGTHNGTSLAVWFGDCGSSVQLYTWNGKRSQFHLDGLIALDSVAKIIVVTCGGVQKLLVRSKKCGTGIGETEVFSLVAVETPGTRILKVGMNSVLDFDVLHGCEQTDPPVLAILHHGRLSAETLLPNGTLFLIAEIALPADASRLRRFTESEDDAWYVLVEFVNAEKVETVIYAVQRRPRNQMGIRRVQLLAPVFLDSVDSFLDDHGRVGLIVRTEDVLPVFQFFAYDPNSINNPWTIVGTLSESNDRPFLSMAAISSHVGQEFRLYLAINRGSEIDVRLQTSVRGSGVSTKMIGVARLADENVSALQWFWLNGRLHLANLAQQKWTVYEILEIS